MKELTGKISKIDLEMGYGFIQCPKHEDVFFSVKTELVGLQFSDLAINDSVRISVKETERGLFADSLARETSKQRDKNRSPEVSV